MWYAVILGGGSGSRMGAGKNKVLLPVAGQSMLCRSVRAFEKEARQTIVVIRDDDRAEAEQQLKSAGLFEGILFAPGGDSRQASVANALKQLPDDGFVAVHDGARCLVDPDTIHAAMRGAEMHGAAVAAVPCIDTIKQVNDDHFVTATPDRSSLMAVQTPQCFSISLLKQAHKSALQEGFLGTDDASLVERIGHPVLLTNGARSNIKLTTPEDMKMAQNLLGGLPAIRVGQGYDVHRLVEGRDLILCGVKVPHTLGLLGHSDADVALHALMDAMLGAAALGDIGKHFPDTDMRYKGISSMLLLEHVTALLKENHLRVSNADVTIVAQKPKLLPYIPQMRANVADVLQLPQDRVNVKATTTERLGFEGEEKGISAQAVVLLTAC